MNTFKIILLIILFFLFFSTIQVNASDPLKAPNPTVYNNPNELMGLDTYDQMGKSPWIVFADRDNVKLYKDKQLIYRTDFLEKFKVIHKKKSKIYVEKYDNPKIKGWGDMTNFLVLPQAIKSKHAISHKVILTNKFGRIEGPSDIVKPLKSPTSNISKDLYTNKNINLLEFAYVYKYHPSEQNADYVLIGNANIFLPYETDHMPAKQVIFGWVPKQRFVMWNTREGLQPKMDRKHPIYFFNRKEDLETYYNSPISKKDILPTWEKVKSVKDRTSPLTTTVDNEDYIDKTPWPPEMPRYLILNPGDKDSPFKIGILGASASAKTLIGSSAETLRIIQHIERENELSDQVDIMFLFDATMSMDKYYVLVGNIATKLFEEFKQKYDKIRFGVTVYRDYVDNAQRFEIKQELTDNLAKIQDVFTKKLLRYNYEDNPDRIKKDYDPNAVYPEAVYQGIVRCIKGTNWSLGGRRLIVHVGDAGNHSRGRDKYTPEDIAKLMVEEKISYNAIQIEKSDASIKLEERTANQLFCQQIRSIIKETASGWIKEIKKIKTNNVLPDTQSYVSQLTDPFKQIINHFNGNKCCHTCCDYGSDRWVLNCIKTDDKNRYTASIYNKIKVTSERLIECKQQFDTMRLGSLPDLSDSNSTFRPQLMPELIKRLINRIGNDYVSKINSSKKVKEEALSLFSENDIMNISDMKTRNRIIYQWGSIKLSEYLKKGGQFYTTSYVRYSHPSDGADLFQKMVLLQKRELEELIRPLANFQNKFQGTIDQQNFKIIFKDFVKAIIGQKELHSMDITVDELYKQEWGISLRSTHKVLSIPYKDIESGNYALTYKESEKLSNSLIASYNKLKKITENETNYFRMFGHKYVWIEAAILP